ncbi:MAG: DUF2330 domain-containing protein [Polyangiaceae bacterium]|nr:DUF2330 domain-containing protein [Polyangiaceae bacterium]
MTTLVSGSAAAFPGFIVGKSDAKRSIHTGQIVIMRKGDTSVVTVMADYEGPLDSFALVVVVPPDVTEERIKTLKRDFVDRVDQISAPRFHEFYETDPCDPEKPIQLWEWVIKAEDTGFLGMNIGGTGEKRKVPKEMLINVESDYKRQGEYAYTLLAPDQPLGAWLGERGYKAPPTAEQVLRPYLDAGARLVIAEVNPNRVELLGGNRSTLSPIQFWSDKPYDTIPSTVGLLSLSDAQELLVYVLHPDQRYEPKNYEVIYPPTDIHVDPKVEEKMGEFYVALYDRMMKQHPLAFVEEYAWSADKCGQPCATEPLLLNEALSLGGDVFELSVPAEEKQPEPPELTDEEKKKQEEDLKPLKPVERVKAKKELEDERKELYRRKALIARHHYTLSRFHRRYAAKGLPKDPTIGPAGPVRGGVDIPQGPNGESPTDVRPAEENMLQARYIYFHPWKGVINCEKPVRWRWAKKWRTVFKRNKIWIADDLARRNRTLINLDKVIWTPVPALGIKGGQPKPAIDAGADAGAGTEANPEAKKSSCGCRIVGSESSGGLALSGLALLILAVRRRRGGTG